jgi:phosphoribosylformylglycinamidine cyclo-ligase
MKDLYAQAGVDIDKGEEVVRRIKKILPDIGRFGGLFDLSEILKSYRHPMLVQSIDGVGTKLIVAKMMNKYDTVGEDIVNHSCNDIIAMGARPLTFLDYVANETLDVAVMEQIVSGMARACKGARVALLGGETAEMPGTYAPGEHDIAGAITGIVEKDKIITGEKIKEGDLIVGFPSSGLHTNGYSLARKLLFEVAGYGVGESIPALGETVGDALLRVHTNYAQPVLSLLYGGVEVRGIAHITGGGFIENIPRVLPKNLDAEIKKGTWPVLPIFSLLQEIGKAGEEEMFRTFNMGIGMVIIASPKEKAKIEKILKKYMIFEIGRIIQGEGQVIFK